MCACLTFFAEWPSGYVGTCGYLMNEGNFPLLRLGHTLNVGMICPFCPALVMILMIYNVGWFLADLTLILFSIATLWS